MAFPPESDIESGIPEHGISEHDIPERDAPEDGIPEDGGSADVSGGSRGAGDVGLAELSRMAERADLVVDRLRARVFAPGRAKRLDLRFGIGKAAAMAGRPRPLGAPPGVTPEPVPVAAIRAAEADGRLPPPETRRGRPAYDLAAVNAMRALFGTLPWRAPSEQALVLAVQSFKGGVGKTALTCHLAQYLALKGYRVCVIDCDSQASATSLFGLNPDADVDEETETLYPFFRHGGPTRLDYALRTTHWPGIALIPANLGLYDAEYEFAARLMQESGRALDRLRAGIDTIRDRFDVVLIDPPPALGMISLSVLRAADALLVPAPPNNIDFASTGHFLRMMVATLTELARGGPAPAYRFVRIVATRMNEAKGAHLAIKRMMDGVFPNEMLEAVLCDSAEIDNAAARLMTVYELTGAATRTATHRRCRASLDAVGAEVEGLIRQCWPSHARPDSGLDSGHPGKELS